MIRIPFCRRAAAGLLTALLLFALTGCRRTVPDIANGAAKAEYPIAVRGVTLEKAVSAAAVYSDSLADMVMSLGSAYQLKLAARSADCTGTDIQVLPPAGTAQQPDLDRLSELGVDLILTETAFSEEVQTSLTQKGIRTLVLPKANDRNELTALYAALASALGGGKTGYETGTKRASSLLMSLDDVQRIIPKSDTVLVTGYIQAADGTFATDQTMTGKLFSYVGARNLAADQGTFTAAELLTANPDVLFCAKGLKSTIAADPRFAALDAVKNGKLYEISAAAMEWQGNAMLDGVLRLAATLYPSLESDGLITVDPAPDEPEPAPAPEHPASVNEQSSYNDILTLQNRLIELGYMNPPGDGTYGYWTKACIKEFQLRAKLEETGIADEKTMAALYAEDAPKG